MLEYVWRQWDFAPVKLDALRQQLLSPRVTVACSGSSGEGAEAQAPPLLQVEYMHREDDYLAGSYALGIRACLSLGLPDMPQGLRSLSQQPPLRCGCVMICADLLSIPLCLRAGGDRAVRAAVGGTRRP